MDLGDLRLQKNKSFDFGIGIKLLFVHPPTTTPQLLIPPYRKQYFIAQTSVSLQYLFNKLPFYRN